MSKWPLPAALLALLLALAAIAPASANPPCGVGSHPACETPTPPSDPEMAVIDMRSFETQGALSESDNGATSSGFSGTAAISTAQARTGTASARFNPASGASGFLSLGNSAT